MRHAIFFAVTRDAEVEIRIAQFGRATDGAFMKRLSLAARTLRIALPARRYFTPMARLVNNFWPEKDYIIA